MGDADRTPEDVIATWAFTSYAGEATGITDEQVAHNVLRALAAAGFAVVPAADVDAAARLRAENERLQADINTVGRIARERDEAIDRALKVQVYNIHLRSAVTDYLDPTKSLGPSSLREALNYDPAAAVGSVEPEGERCPTCGAENQYQRHARELCGMEPCPDPWHSPDRGQR